MARGPGGTRLLRQDLLAEAAGLARRRGVGAAAPRPAGAPARRGRAGLEPGRARQRQRAGAKGGEATGPNPTDRGKPGTKRHLVIDARGTPLGLALSGANRHDSRMLAPTLDAVPGVRDGRRGRPRRRPDKLHADKGYDHPRCRRECRARGIRPRIARRGVDTSARLGRHRWVVERTLAWLGQFRRLAVRHERRADLHLALTTLACAIICLRQVRRFCPQPLHLHRQSASDRSWRPAVRRSGHAGQPPGALDACSSTTREILCGAVMVGPEASMRLAGVVSMAGAAALVVVAFLHLPIPYLQVKPMKPSERLPSLWDIGADDPGPPPPTAQQVAKMQGIFGGMCRTSVRSESERRKLAFPGERVDALCGCLVRNAIETRFTFDGREGFENYAVIAGRDTASKRMALSDAQYRAMIAGAERACAQGQEAAAENRPQGRPASGTDLLEGEREAARAAAEHRRRAEAGSAEARAALAEALRDGRGVDRDDVEAVRLFRMAADQGSARGMVGLGTMHTLGRGGAAWDPAEAAALYRKAAEAGSAEGRARLAVRHHQGSGVARDRTRAYELARDAAAHGDPWGQAALGVMFRDGVGVRRDDAEAAIWFRRSAEQANPWGQFYLGAMRDREAGGLGPDSAEALRLLRLAARQGLADAEHELGSVHADGRAVPADQAEAVRWYALAASRGYTPAWTEYGRRLLSGRGVARDEVAAAGWFSRAVERGDFKAALLLGHLHEFGRGVPRDLLRAADVYKALAERGGGGAAEARSRLCALRDYVPEAEKAGPRFGVCEPRSAP